MGESPRAPLLARSEKARRVTRARAHSDGERARRAPTTSRRAMIYILQRHTEQARRHASRSVGRERPDRLARRWRVPVVTCACRRAAVVYLATRARGPWPARVRERIEPRASAIGRTPDGFSKTSAPGPRLRARVRSPFASDVQQQQQCCCYYPRYVSSCRSPRKNGAAVRACSRTRGQADRRAGRSLSPRTHMRAERDGHERYMHT